MPSIVDSLLTGGVPAIADYLLSEKVASDIRETGTSLQEGATTLGTNLASAAAGTFKPFTVTTGLGPGISIGPSGSVSVDIPETQLADTKALARSGAQQLLKAIGPGDLQREQERIQGMLLGQGLDTAQQDVFNQLQALRAPEQERQRLALENRLFQQGREGIRTEQYGGTPEQLAFEKAIQEQQAADALMARQQAGSEQQQRAGLIAQALGQGRQQQALQAELGIGGVQAAFLPQQQALSLLSAATPYSQLATQSALQGIIAQGEMGLGGLQARTQAEQLANAYEIARLQELSNALFGTGQEEDLGLFGKILGEFGIGS
jgi:hypothetical protein